MENKKILIYAEIADGKLQSSAYELMAKARTVFPEDAQIAYVTCGDNIAETVFALSQNGADAVYACESHKLKLFNIDYHSTVISEAIRAFDPDVLLIPASAYGEELAPSLALQFDTAGAAHCVDILLSDDGRFVTHVPAFGGRIIGEILIPGTRPQIASIKPGLFSADTQPARKCDLININSTKIDAVNSKIRAIKIEQNPPAGIPIEESDLLVVGGFGIGSQENWDKLEELADKLGGTTACTRPVLDEGWVKDDNKMIGTSGKSVRPKVYLGFGVSGSTHHMCGMQDSDVIIAVNKDEDAPIFDASDYCAVSNLDVVDALLKKLG
jgi:electron transfer flavoprotein alpha subunit